MPTRSSTASYLKTRHDHAIETAEDYVEAVTDLIDEVGVCRVTNLARRMGVSHVTASRIVSRLSSEGLLETAPYRPIELTPEGRSLAKRARRRHEIVLSFLRALGVPDDHAQHDAEGIEHHCSPATLRAMERFTRSPTP